MKDVKEFFRAARRKIDACAKWVHDRYWDTYRAISKFLDSPVGQVLQTIFFIALFVLFAIACIALILFLGTIALVGGAIFLVGCALEVLTVSPEEYELMRINRKLDRIFKSK